MIKVESSWGIGLAYSDESYVYVNLQFGPTSMQVDVHTAKLMAENLQACIKRLEEFNNAVETLG